MVRVLRPPEVTRRPTCRWCYAGIFDKNGGTQPPRVAAGASSCVIGKSESAGHTQMAEKPGMR